MRLKWGVLGAAKIAVEKVIPAMQQSERCEVYGIASRNLEKAEGTAIKLNIPKTYDSYEALIADPDIDVIYNPLPNHLHAEYTLKCIEAGKHVLCEKPIALNSADVQKLITARDTAGVKVGEAFMVKTHPQWLEAKRIIQSGALGQMSMIQGIFSYSNTDPENIRNILAYGGGAMWDIGCYPIFTSRFVLDEEPLKVLALTQFDEKFGTDVLSSVIMQFPSAQVSFVVGTQMVAYQRMNFLGRSKRLEIQIPFNAPRDQPCRLLLDKGDILQRELEEILIPTCDQYQLQMDAFTKAVLEDTDVPVTLEDSLENTRVIEAIFQSAKEGKWIGM